MFEGDLNEDRREAKHDGARIVRNVWKAQPTCNSEGFYKTGKMLHWTPFPGQNRELGDEMTPRLDSKPAAEGDRRLPVPRPPLPAQCPAVVQGPSKAGFVSAHLTAKMGSAAGSETLLRSCSRQGSFFQVQQGN